MENKKPYGNYEVYHPTGKLMFFCNKKKFNWYIKKGLADKISEKSIRLTFVPNGFGEDPEYLTPRENICVITGSTDNLTKHHVVPTQYRQHFPMKYKSKNSGDVVTLTRDEHDKYERFADVLKQELSDKYLLKDEINYNITLNYIQKLFNTIKSFRDDLPKDRVGDLYKTINLSLKDIEKVYNNAIEIRHIDKLEPLDLNKLIVERVGIEELIIMWKNHFIEYSNPKYLPDWWDPNHVKIVDN
jgi:hypothetical protein